jgi:hypothetical protein
MNLLQWRKHFKMCFLAISGVKTCLHSHRHHQEFADESVRLFDRAQPRSPSRNSRSTQWVAESECMTEWK